MAAITDVKTVRIFKRRGGAGTGKPYSNTYHILSPGSLKDAALTAKVNLIIQTERTLASNQVFFQRAVISTYAKKEVVGGSDKPLVKKINQFGLRDMTAGSNTPVDRWLPPEACLVIQFGGGIGKGGDHLYRHSIGPGDWYNMGNGVELIDTAIINATAAWMPLFNDINGNPPIVFITEDEDGQPTDTVTEASCAGYRLKQLTQKKGKKKSAADFDPLEDNDAEAADEIAQAVEILQRIENKRFTEKGAAFFTSGTFLAALSAIGGAYQLVKASKDANDYGPNAVGQ